MEFTYHGMVRYAYGFANPNHAAALLAMLLPLFWYGRIYWRENRSIVFMLFSCELMIYAGIIMTYSRSGMLAVIFGGGIFYLLFRYYSKLSWCPNLPNKWQLNRHKLILISAITGLMILAIFSGAGERSISWLSNPDRSVTNRFVVWQGGLQMLADNPTGIGLGKSGTIYTLFYQHHDKRTQYRTMVNSFITFINECGIGYWSVLSLLSGFIIIAAISLVRNRKTPQHKKLQLTTFFSIIMIIFIVGNSSTCFDLSVISTINSSDGSEALNAWLQLLLIALPVILIFWASIIILCHRHLFSWRKVTVITFAVILIINISLLTLGALMNRSRPYSCQIIKNDGNNYIKLAKRSSANITVAGFTDEAIVPTESFVVWLKQRYPDANLLLTLPQRNLTHIGTESLNTCQYIVACGQENLPVDKASLHKTILLFPKQPPSSSQLLPSKVILDYYDSYGNNIFWEQLFPKAKKEYFNKILR